MTVCLICLLLCALILMRPSCHLLHHLFPKPPLIGGEELEKTQNALCLPLPESRKPTGKCQPWQWHGHETGHHPGTACAPLGGTGSRRGGLLCCGRWRQPGMDPSFTHKISMAPWSECEIALWNPTRLALESLTWYQQPLKEDISKYHLIASPEGTYPNHFNRFLSNLFSKLPPCRFSQQPVFHFVTSLKVQTFILLPGLNSCLMSSCISQWSWRKTDCHAF